MLISAKRVATLLQVSRWTVARLVQQGKIPPPAGYVGKRARWDEKTIRRWIDAGCRA